MVSKLGLRLSLGGRSSDFDNHCYLDRLWRKADDAENATPFICVHDRKEKCP